MRCGWPRTPRSVADWSEAVRVAVIVLDHDALRVLRVVVQKQPGEKGFVVPAEGASCMKIIMPEMVVGRSETGWPGHGPRSRNVRGGCMVELYRKIWNK